MTVFLRLLWSVFCDRKRWITCYCTVWYNIPLWCHGWSWFDSFPRNWFSHYISFYKHFLLYALPWRNVVLKVWSYVAGIGRVAFFLSHRSHFPAQLVSSGMVFCTGWLAQPPTIPHVAILLLVSASWRKSLLSKQRSLIFFVRQVFWRRLCYFIC